jgi:hypothetical protein
LGEDPADEFKVKEDDLLLPVKDSEKIFMDEDE